MDILLQQIKKALYKLDELQAGHIKSFQSQVLPDLEKQIIERQAGFYELKKNMATFLQKTATVDIMEDTPMVQDVKEYLRLLMYQNKTLRSLVETHKNELETSMKHIVKGRRTIHAYGSLVSKSNRPKVISLRK